jgi:molybdate transport system substrate-binding protein
MKTVSCAKPDGANEARQEGLPAESGHGLQARPAGPKAYTSAALVERRSFLRWMSGVGICALSLAIGSRSSPAQHHQHAGPQVSPGQVSPDQVSPGQVSPGQVSPGQVSPGQVLPNSEAPLIFAAATLKPALDEVVRSYQAEGGPKPSVAYGPTPTLAKNIADGAPADILFSADVLWMDYLAERKLIRDHTRIDVVRNEIVLVQGDNHTGSPAVTVGPSFPMSDVVGSGPIAMCNPESHPAGRYARLRLKESNLWDPIASRIAIVENPQVAALMVARGDATAAVVFATDIHDVSGVRIAGTFPDQARSPIVYPAAVTADAPHPEAARRLLEYLRSPDARKIFERFGYR